MRFAEFFGHCITPGFEHDPADRREHHAEEDDGGCVVFDEIVYMPAWGHKRGRGSEDEQREGANGQQDNQQSASGQQSVLLGRTAATASDTRRVLVKVEELR